jgi:cobalt/nickel transport system ATP-binding protein
LPREEVTRRVEAAMARTGIAQLRDKPTHALSHGQKKRVAIAGILAMEPEVMIFDEPTAGLDPMGVSELMRLLAGLRDTLGVTILLATHDIDLVPLYCGRVCMLRGGRLAFDGTPRALFADAAGLRENDLRLPRLAHLAEILRERDGIDLGAEVSTIAQARRAIRGAVERARDDGQH